MVAALRAMSSRREAGLSRDVALHDGVEGEALAGRGDVPGDEGGLLDQFVRRDDELVQQRRVDRAPDDGRDDVGADRRDHEPGAPHEDVRRDQDRRDQRERDLQLHRRQAGVDVDVGRPGDEPLRRGQDRVHPDEGVERQHEEQQAAEDPQVHRGRPLRGDPPVGQQQRAFQEVQRPRREQRDPERQQQAGADDLEHRERKDVEREVAAEDRVARAERGGAGLEQELQPVGREQRPDDERRERGRGEGEPVEVLRHRQLERGLVLEGDRDQLPPGAPHHRQVAGEGHGKAEQPAGERPEGLGLEARDEDLLQVEAPEPEPVDVPGCQLRHQNERKDQGGDDQRGHCRGSRVCHGFPF